MEMDHDAHDLKAHSLTVYYPQDECRLTNVEHSSFFCFLLKETYFCCEYNNYWKRIFLLMKHLREKGPVTLPTEQADTCLRMLDCLRDCTRQGHDGWATEAATSATKMLLCTLFAQVEELTGDVLKRNGHAVSWRNEEIAGDFLQHVADHFRRERSVAFYASCLCITPKYLSSVVKDVTGLPPCRWIDNMVVEEIGHLLQQTNLSIKEIANRMNFPTVSFLGKYFRQRKGLSPKKYREKMLTLHPY